MKIPQILLVNVISAVLLAACQGGGNSAYLANQALMRTDVAFSAQSARAGFAAAFDQYARDDALLLPDNHAAIEGKAAIVASLKSLPTGSALTWSPQGADVSSNLGYSWGIYTLTGNNSAGQVTVAYGKYLSVWKRQAGDWQLAAMMINSTPGPAGG